MFAFFKSLYKRIVWWWTGGLLSVQLEDKASDTRTEAEYAVERVVYETNIAHDCVSATIIRGGPCILVTHDGAKEAFIHNSYAEAADKAIQWLRANDVRYSEQSKLSRRERRAFDSYRRRAKSAREKMQ